MKQSFRIGRSPGHIFDYLSNMQKFVTVHPVITKIERSNDGSYLVYETLKLSFIPFSFTYKATVESNLPEKKVIMHVTVMKYIKIEMEFLLKPAESFTMVEENIVFQAPWPVKSIMRSIFKKQHKQLFRNIEMTR